MKITVITGEVPLIEKLKNNVICIDRFINSDMTEEASIGLPMAVSTKNIFPLKILESLSLAFRKGLELQLDELTLYADEEYSIKYINYLQKLKEVTGHDTFDISVYEYLNGIKHTLTFEEGAYTPIWLHELTSQCETLEDII